VLQIVRIVFLDFNYHLGVFKNLDILEAGSLSSSNNKVPNILGWSPLATLRRKQHQLPKRYGGLEHLDNG